MERILFAKKVSTTDDLQLSTNEYVVFVMLFNALAALFCTHVDYVCSDQS